MSWRSASSRTMYRIKRDVEDWKRARTASRRNRNRKQLRKWVVDARNLLRSAPRNADPERLDTLWAYWFVANRLVGPTPHWRIDRAYNTLRSRELQRRLVEAKRARPAPREREPAPAQVRPGVIATIATKVKDMANGKPGRVTFLGLKTATAEDEARFRRMVELAAEVRRTGNLGKARILFGLAQELLHVMESGKYRRMPAAMQTAIRRAIDEAIRIANVALNPTASMRFDGGRSTQQTLGPTKATLLLKPTVAQFQALAREVATLTGQVRSTGNRDLAFSLKEKVALLETWALRPHIKAALLRMPSHVQRALLAGVAAAKRVAEAAIAGTVGPTETDYYYTPSGGGGGGGGGGYYSGPSDLDTFFDEDEEDEYEDEDEDEVYTPAAADDGAYWSADEDEIEVDDLEFLDDGEELAPEEDGEEVITDEDAAALVEAAAPPPPPELRRAPVGLVDRLKASVRAHPLLWAGGAAGAAYLGHRYWTGRGE